MKNILIALLIFTGSVYSQDNIKEVTILHWNDFHAKDLPLKGTKKDSTTGESVTYYYGGTSDMLGYINKFRNDRCLVLNAGDDFQGTPISNFTRGKSQIELLNLFNIDAFVVGNHEFDYSMYALDSALALAQFNVLSANIYNNLTHTTFGKPYIIKEINGVKIGILGISPPELFGLTLPKNVADVTMLNLDSVITTDVAVLKSEKCNLIVLLTHEGTDNDKLLAEKYYRDVDVIVGGHSHTPLFKPVVDSGVVIVQAGSYSRWFGKLDLKVDVDKDTLVGYYGKLIETVMDSSIYDKAAEEKVEGMIASIGGELMKVIGELKGDWTASYSKESTIGQFQTDAFKSKTGTDIAFINGGGLRKGMPKGNITVGDIWEINPFGNEVHTFSVTGRTLKEMIANNTRIRLRNINQGETGEMLAVSGMTYSYDSRKMATDSNNIVLNIEVNGKPVDDNKVYTISTNNYVTGQFTKFFGDIPEKIEFKNTGLLDRDVIIDAVEKQKIIAPVLEQRIVDVAENK
jgi:5'-nucleotidase / UDP-sugar diphosphatase